MLSLCTTLAAQKAVVLVLPGGSYCWHDHRHEDRPVVQWLQEQGYAAEVVDYPVAGWWHWLWGTQKALQPLSSVQQAIAEARTEYPGLPVGVLGFSAGGHLALLSGEYFTDRLHRPDFVAAVYPVVTLCEPYVHQRSRRALLGKQLCYHALLQDSLSAERHVRADMPPVFLLNCQDDKTVRPENSQLMDSALTAAGVAHTYVRYSHGGHGFGMFPKRYTPEISRWPDSLKEFIEMEPLPRVLP